MSVTAHNFIGQNNSSTPAEVISNIFNNDNQQRLHALPNDDYYNRSLGTSLVRIKANLDVWNFANSGINNDIMTVLQKPIYGVLTSELTYSIQSEWEPFQLPPILDLNQYADFVVVTGGGEIGAVARSQKYWRKSGDIKISPSFRILDVNGDGAAIQFVQALLLMTTAVGAQEIDGVKEALDTASGAVMKVGEALVGAIPDAPTPAAGSKGVDPSGGLNVLASIGKTYLSVGTTAISTLIKNASDYGVLRACPPPVDVQIGKVFHHPDMVITDLSVVYSKECTAAGPIYADVTLQLVSRKIIADVTEVGLASKGLLNLNENPNPYANISMTYDISESQRQYNKSSPDAITGADKAIKFTAPAEQAPTTP